MVNFPEKISVLSVWPSSFEKPFNAIILNSSIPFFSFHLNQFTMQKNWGIRVFSNDPRICIYSYFLTGIALMRSSFGFTWIGCGANRFYSLCSWFVVSSYYFCLILLLLHTFHVSHCSPVKVCSYCRFVR